jgi:hypothetical protein
MKDKIKNAIFNNRFVKAINVIGIHNDAVVKTNDRISNTILKFHDGRKFRANTITIFDIIDLKPIPEISTDVIIEVLEKHNWVKRIENNDRRLMINDDISSEFKPILKRELEVMFGSYWSVSADWIDSNAS